MEGRILEQQFSRMIACAQEAEKLDSLGKAFLSGLVSFDLPDPLRKTGLRVETKNGDATVVVKAHGHIIESLFKHAWLYTNRDQGREFPKLVGHIQFWLLGRETAQDKVLYEIVFDDEGNGRIGKEKYLSSSISEDGAKRKALIGLLTAIQDALPHVILEY